ncbi:response regulator transcription factor [Fusibacillus kribbianus]|uniref:Stage 0 sporulation protein A homolog n=1 Tax=Fusibacillus kribbianus TaxID=3044208 RepID=A0AAP4B9R8_9FIRM|nr:response regulator transcription factor [Ruminococcus sp. YH-rum2234]MDI9241298.1 response regulator transcription factor [Ruminococcus sp. YH-rum2234]
MRILIVEDEVRLAEALAQIMEEQGYTADLAYDGITGLDYAESGIYDVVVLDVMLPGMNGFDVVRTMRKHKNQTPVLMLTARFATGDKVRGLDCGADDYLTKPFETEELLARIRAVSRRTGEVAVERLSYGDVSLNLSTYMLERGGKSVHLGKKEFEVMRLLLSNPKAVLPKETLLLKIWGSESDAEDNNVEVYISFLRKKLAFLGASVTIGTVRKIGYRMEEGTL